MKTVRYLGWFMVISLSFSLLWSGNVFGQEREEEFEKGSYYYEQKFDEDCKEVNTICLHFFVLDGSGTNFAWRAEWDKDQVFGKLNPDARKALNRLIDLLNSLWDQCCIRFELGIARAVKSEKISAGAGKKLKDLLTTTPEGDVIVKAARKEDRKKALDLAEEALEDIKAKLQGKGEWPKDKDKCLAVFVVGEVESKKAGFARMPGKVSIFELSYRKDTLFEPPQIYIY